MLSINHRNGSTTPKKLYKSYLEIISTVASLIYGHLNLSLYHPANLCVQCIYGKSLEGGNCSDFINNHESFIHLHVQCMQCSSNTVKKSFYSSVLKSFYHLDEIYLSLSVEAINLMAILNEYYRLS